MPKGFSLEFILFKEFFGATLNSVSTIEDYLVTIKWVAINLKVKNLELLNKFIIAWTLHNLDYKFKGFMVSMTQTYRAETVDINIDALFVNLLNKARWMESLGEDKYNNTLFTKTRKPLRAKYRGCGKTSYAKESYYKLHLKLRPKRVEEEEASPITNILFASLSD